MLTNNGSGGFVLASSPAVGNQPNSVAAGDLDGDGQIDLITANIGANTLSVLLNNPRFAADFTGNGSSLTNLNASQLTTGTVSLARLPAAVLTNNATGVTLTGTFSGNGAALTNLNADQLDAQHGAFYQNAANLNAGTLADARLSANVALLNGTNVFAGTNRFAGVLLATNVNNQLTGAFTGNAGSLTNISGANLTGTVADARLSSNVALLNGTNVFTSAVTFSGTLYGSAPYLKFAEVTNVAAGSAVAGTNNWRIFNVELADTHNLGSTNGAGDIILPAGTYQCRISAPAFRVQTHQIRLRTSTGVNLLFGTMGYSDESTSGSQDRSQIDGQFTLATSTTLRVQHWCTLAHATDGLGALLSFDWGDANQTIFAVAEFWKIR
jgi:hypothetical protein